MRNLCWLVLMVGCWSCGGSNDIPGDIIAPKKMQLVLTDILIADAVNNERVSKDTGFKVTDHNKAAMLQIFKNYKISKEEFQKSYDFYLSHPDLLKPIADSISATGTRMIGELNSDTTQKKIHGNHIRDTARQMGH
ncbi:MAG: DUF4296 domain-containing protein [Chitinophagaceae bacterium]|nr:DUF4296 domain-containing protein [Chitinophagaceae bacterium]